MNLNDKVIILTGASGGIGKALVNLLYKEGAKLTIAGRYINKLKALIAQCHIPETKVLALSVDLRDEKSICQLFKKSKKYWGRLDGLINNAAFGIAAPIHNGSSDVWREMLEVNVLAVTIAMREALHYFDKKIGGHIINLSSTSAYRISPGGGFYAATKFSVRALSEILRQELTSLKSPTKVSCVSPGRVATKFFNEETSSAPDNTQLNLLNPEDVAEAIVYQLKCPEHVAIQDIIMRSYKQVT